MNHDFSTQIKNKYSISTRIKLIYWVIKTKIISRKARIIRFPFDIRGKKYIDLGEGLTTGVGCRLEAFSSNQRKVLFFGKNVQMNDYVHISAMKSIEIGNHVLMASKIYISDNTHGFYSSIDEENSHPETPPINRIYNCKPIKIEDNVWIGESVSILSGVIIGKGSIIGANSVVTKNIPAYTIAVGIPAKSIKYFNWETSKWEKINNDHSLNRNI